MRVNDYIPCRICSAPIPIKEKRVTCSLKCAEEWEKSIIARQLKNDRTYGKKSSCPRRKTREGKPTDVVCSEHDEAICGRCGWNPKREAELIKNARARYALGLDK